VPTATLTSKYQITVPRQVRETLRLAPGDRLLFRILQDGQVVVEPENAPMAALRGRLKAPAGRHLSVEDMDDVIRTAAVHRLGGRNDRR
jgi:AbrB family looped-hinge helix DNA binding protein